MVYTLKAFASDTLASQLLAGGTSATLTTGVFGSMTGEQLLVIDPNNSKREIIKCTIAGTALTSLTRGVDGTSAVQHEAGAIVRMAFVPSHHEELKNTYEWKKISHTAYTNQTADVTISGLTGNTDIAYKIILEGVAATSGDYNITCKPNNDTTAGNYVHSRHYFHYVAGVTHTVDQPSMAGFNLGASVYSGNSNIIGELHISAKDRNLPRCAKSEFTSISSTDKAVSLSWASLWNNTADEITSLTISFPSITFTGTITVLKLV